MPSSNGKRMRFMTSLICAAMLAWSSLSAAWGAELILVRQDGCHWCEHWESEIGVAYPKTREGVRAPLRRVNLRDLPDDISFTSRPVFTPTFVLVHDGQELGRIEGYPGADFFWPMLVQLLDAHPAKTVPQI